MKKVLRVREDLGYVPLVTSTSQIVGVQAVLNVLTGERYKVVTKETRDFGEGNVRDFTTVFADLRISRM